MGNIEQLKNNIDLLIKDKSLLAALAKNATAPRSFDQVADEVEREYLSVAR